MAKTNTAPLVLVLLVMAVFLTSTQAAGRGYYQANNYNLYQPPPADEGEGHLPWENYCWKHLEYCLWHLVECHFCIGILTTPTTTITTQAYIGGAPDVAETKAKAPTTP